ncbi:hypothetical protein WH91_20955 [Devosia psychrophila]|uniref:Uncharacterized protein n=1 Tax=Devosia psychrophila TaxID=728005 RepID=A0ABR5DT20_9HYPH|nr:hypothetical protein [Devosia psychrophila]KKC31171.1 hypothetical protein WH91_20955 [Devosia psychrophila]
MSINETWYYPLMILAVLAALWQAVRRDRLRLPRDKASLCFLAAFALIAVAFSVTAQGLRDMAYSANFIMFVLFAPLSVVLSRAASGRNTVVLATLALAGSVIGTVIAAYQVFIVDAGRATSYGSDPIWSTQAAIIVGFIALLGMVSSTSRYRFFFVLGPILGVATAVLSGSRGPILAVPFLVIIFVLLGGRRWWIALLATVVALLLGTNTNGAHD